MEVAALAAFVYGAVYLATMKPPPEKPQPSPADTITITSIRQRIGDAIGTGAELGASPYLEDVDPVVLAVSQMAPRTATKLPVPQTQIKQCETRPDGAPGMCQHVPGSIAEAPIAMERPILMPIDNSSITLRKAPQTVPADPLAGQQLEAKPVPPVLISAHPVVSPQVAAWFAAQKNSI